VQAASAEPKNRTKAFWRNELKRLLLLNIVADGARLFRSLTLFNMNYNTTAGVVSQNGTLSDSCK
jgi:hypothetical protein